MLIHSPHLLSMLLRIRTLTILNMINHFLFTSKLMAEIKRALNVMRKIWVSFTFSDVFGVSASGNDVAHVERAGEFSGSVGDLAEGVEVVAQWTQMA